jgi:colicin import membrane protein
MLKELLKNPTALLYAVLVHAVLIAILVFSIQWNGKPAPLQGSEKIVQATVIDEAKLEAEKQRKLEEAQRRRDQAEAKRRAEEERQRQVALEQRRAEEAQRKKQQEAERQHQAKLKAERQARQAEQKRQAELAAQRKAEEAQRQAEAKRKADEARRQKENLEMMRQQMAQEEADRAAQAAAAQRQRELASLRDQYANAIAQKVERNWIRPAAAAQSGSCQVRVKQIPGGDVVSVDASACVGDPSYRQSVEAAVFRAAPLPQPPDPAVFDRDIIFTFKPNQ